MTQIVRNLTDARDGFLRGAQYLILDRDPVCSSSIIARPRSPAGRVFAHDAVGRAMSHYEHGAQLFCRAFGGIRRVR